MEETTILVVDDDPASVHALIEYLHTSGFRAIIAPSGERALQQVERIQPDLILLDVLMPGSLDGFETCRRLKTNEQSREIPVIFMTALSDTVDKVKGFEAGGADYLTKPLQHEEVLARVNVHLALRKFQQQLQAQNLLLEDKNILLEEQNARFQKLSEATFEGIIIHDQGWIVEVNHALEKMFGYQRSEMIDRNILEFVVPAFRDIVRQHISNDDVSLYEVQAIRENGEKFPIEIQATTMPYQGRNIRIAAVRDISWRKAMEEEKAHLEKENLNLRTTLKERYKFGEIIGRSPLMQEIYELVAHTAATDANVIITGTIRQLPARIIEALRAYNWPGNIRELQNVLQRYFTVGRLDFNEPTIANPPEEDDILASEVDRQEGSELYKTLEAFEKQYLTKMLERHHWHKTKTARALGIPRRTLHRKIKKLEII